MDKVKFCRIIFLKIIIWLGISSCANHENSEISSSFPLFTCQVSPEYQGCDVLNSAYYLIIEALDYNSAFDKINEEISRSSANLDYESMAKFYSYYFILPDLAANRIETEYFVKDAGNILFKDLSFKSKWNLTYALHIYFVGKRDGDNSLNYAIKLKKLSDEKQSEILRAISLKAIGVSYQLSGNYKNAASNLFSALYFSEVSGDLHTKKSILFAIADFYRRNAMIEQAIEYKKKELELYSPVNTLDSMDMCKHSTNYVGERRVFR